LHRACAIPRFYSRNPCLCFWQIPGKSGFISFAAVDAGGLPFIVALSVTGHHAVCYDALTNDDDNDNEHGHKDDDNDIRLGVETIVYTFSFIMNVSL